MLKLLNRLPRVTKRRSAVLVAALAALSMGVIHQANANHHLNIMSGSPVSLIDGQDWSDFAGATQTGDTVHIDALGRAIVNQDGSGGQANPPVNVRGPHLVTSGDFEIDATTSLPSTGPASLYFYGAVPIIYDEWRYQPPHIKLDIYHDKLTASMWYGTSDTAKYQKTWTVDAGSQPQLGLIYSSKNLAVTVNGQKLADISNHSIFRKNQVWFGADAPVGTTGWDLQALSVKGQAVIQPGADLTNTTTDSQSIKSLMANSSRNIPIGAAVANYALFSDQGYRNLVASQFDMLTPENELKAQFIHPQPDVYSFDEADSLVEFALANGMTVHGHNLVFSEANPKWMQTAPLDQRQQIMTDHISTVVTHFGSKINEWDVVDEPLNDNDDNNGNSSDLRQNIWFQAMGEQYIDKAFTAAHAANPKAVLYLNEYGLEADGSRWDEFLSLVKRLQARGVPIDGVGFQAHVYEKGDEVDQATLEKHIQILAKMGLKSRISEVDVYGDSAQHQADQYSAIFKACQDQPTCTSINTWGVTDRYGSTTSYHEYPLDYGNDLLWDTNLQPKLAYSSIQQTIKNP